MDAKNEIWIGLASGLVGLFLELGAVLNWWKFEKVWAAVVSFILFFLIGIIAFSLLKQGNIIAFLRQLDKGEYDWFQRNPLLVDFGIRDEELRLVKTDLVIGKGHCYRMENMGVEDYTALIRKILGETKNALHVTSIFFPGELYYDYVNKNYMQIINTMISGRQPDFNATRIMIYYKDRIRRYHTDFETVIVKRDMANPDVADFIRDCNSNFRLRWAEVTQLKNGLTGTKLYGDYAIFDNKIVIFYDVENRDVLLFKEGDFIKPFLNIFEDLNNEIKKEVHSATLGISYQSPFFLTKPLDFP